MRIQFIQDAIDKLRGKNNKLGSVHVEQLPIYNVPYIEPKSTYKTLICPTGFGHSGSGTLLDYFSEFENSTVLGFFDNDYSGLVKEFNTSISEIDFIRCAGGVFDIEKSIGASNYFNDNFIIKLFLHNAEYFYRKGIIYNDYFWQLTNEFVESITDIKIKSTNGFEGLYFLQFLAKRKKYSNLHSPLLIDYPLDRYICYLKDLQISEYRKIAKEYIVKFLKSIESKEFLVCDQILTTSKPETERKTDYFGDFKQICVYRDPRDMYATGQKRKDTQWMPKNPEDFVKWFYHRGTPYYLHAKPHPNRIMIRFEDFVLKYDEMSKIINSFVGIDEKNHVHRQEYFNPEVSKQNIGIYKNYEKQDEIKYIEEKLKEYCYYEGTI